MGETSRVEISFILIDLFQMFSCEFFISKSRHVWQIMYMNIWRMLKDCPRPYCVSCSRLKVEICKINKLYHIRASCIWYPRVPRVSVYTCLFKTIGYFRYPNRYFQIQDVNRPSCRSVRLGRIFQSYYLIRFGLPNSSDVT